MIRPECLVAATEILQYFAKIAVSHGVFRVYCDGLSIQCCRFLALPKRQNRRSKIDIGIGKIGTSGDCVAVSVDGLERPALCGAQQAKTITCNSMAGWRVQNRPIKPLSFGSPAGMMASDGVVQGLLDLAGVRRCLQPTDGYLGLRRFMVLISVITSWCRPPAIAFHTDRNWLMNCFAML